MAPDNKPKSKQTKNQNSIESLGNESTADDMEHGEGSVEEEQTTPLSKTTKSKKTKGRPKSRPKSATKQKSISKRPKSRQRVQSKDSSASKMNTTETSSENTAAFKEKVLAVLETMQSKTSKTTSRPKSQTSSDKRKKRPKSCGKAGNQSK